MLGQKNDVLRLDVRPFSIFSMRSGEKPGTSSPAFSRVRPRSSRVVCQMDLFSFVDFLPIVLFPFQFQIFLMYPSAEAFAFHEVEFPFIV